MRARINGVTFEREDGETVTIRTSDGVVVDLCARSLWRAVPGDGGATVVETGRWMVAVSRSAERG